MNRLNIIYYPIMILAGLGICEVIRRSSLPYLKHGIAIAYAVSFLLFAQVYFTSYADEMDVRFRKDFGEALSSLQESDAEKLYITVGKGQHAMLSEILTLFWCDVDAEYFQGKALPEGLLPYHERYIYHDIGDITVNFAEDAVYVAVGDELSLFDENQYVIERFGSYYVVMKRGTRR